MRTRETEWTSEESGLWGACDGGLPCDLPDEPRERRRAAGRWRIVAAVACAVLACAAAALFIVRGLPDAGPGAVVESAGRGVDGLMAFVAQTGRDVQARAARNEGPVTGTVCIDAGHGGGYDLTLTPIGPGSDQMQYVEPGGTSGVATGRDEAEVTLEVAMLLKAKLQDAGINVVMVREDNDTVLSSEQRARIANACGADLFIRLHCDGSDDPSLSGFSTLIPGYNDWTAGIVEESERAAWLMHPLIVEAIGANDAGIVQRSDLAGFNFCEVPSVLYEMGFMSNPDEDVLLSDPQYQDALAQAMCRAAVAYLESVSG